jgi:pyruvate/2-oxoglutarate dehydrogenase complex dihydrolipoamide acyltransferase (E2) component
MPQAGETMEEGTVVEWKKQEGEPVEKGEILLTVETDKAAVEVESDFSGFLKKILIYHNNGPVPCLTPIAIIGEKNEQIDVERCLNEHR